MQKKPITDWDDEDRPREKLMLKGKQSLNNAELLGILLGTGNREETAVDLAQRLLNSVDNSIVELGRLSIKDLCSFKGIGTAKAIGISAAIELGRRRRESDVLQKKTISSSKDVFEVFQPNLADIPYEEFWVLLLNRANNIIGKYQISNGGVSSTTADPKKIFNIAIDKLASAIILCHNHPSGKIRPSNNDISLTKKIKKAAEILDISLFDHVIIGNNEFFSFADNGLIN